MTRPDPERCDCGSPDCPACYPARRWDRRTERDDEDEWGRYAKPEDLPLNGG